MKLGVTTSSSGYLNDTTGALAYNEAVTAILPINQGVKRITKIVLTYQQDTYPLDTTLIGIIGVRWSKADSAKSLRYVPVNMWAEQEHNTTIGKSGLLKRPSFYDYTDSLLVVFPPPTLTTGDTLEVWGWHRLAHVDSNSVTTQIPEKYRVAVLYHMVWNIAKARQDPRLQLFKDELDWALANIGLKMIGGVVVSDKK
jgi:hypothetical protein